MKNVLLMDSGSGGVNILKECVKVCPYCNYLLYCDTENLPYGTKSKRELYEITKRNLEKIYSFFKFEYVVLACNTLTATVIDEIRKKYPLITFIGTVPAIKPALEENKAKDVLVIATKATIKNNKLIKKYKKSGIKLLPLNDLAPLIDQNLDWLDNLKDYLKLNLKGQFKAIVLGCTHYQALTNQIQELFPDVKIYNSANGVARRLLSFVGKQENINFQVQIFCEQTELLGKFWWYYNL